MADLCLFESKNPGEGKIIETNFSSQGIEMVWEI
jgi:hypothetical protein